MEKILFFIHENISSYSLFLLFSSGLLLIFIDSAELRKSRLLKEMMISFFAGVFYFVISILLFILNVFLAPIR